MVDLETSGSSDYGVILRSIAYHEQPESEHEQIQRHFCRSISCESGRQRRVRDSFDASSIVTRTATHSEVHELGLERRPLKIVHL